MSCRAGKKHCDRAHTIQTHNTSYKNVIVKSLCKWIFNSISFKHFSLEKRLVISRETVNPLEL